MLRMNDHEYITYYRILTVRRLQGDATTVVATKGKLRCLWVHTVVHGESVGYTISILSIRTAPSVFRLGAHAFVGMTIMAYILYYDACLHHTDSKSIVRYYRKGHRQPTIQRFLASVRAFSKTK
jgi:hypothetical protein